MGRGRFCHGCEHFEQKETKVYLPVDGGLNCIAFCENDAVNSGDLDGWAGLITKTISC